MAFLRLLIESLIGWVQDEALRHAAALAFFTIFSLAPLVVLSLAIVSMVLPQAASKAQILPVVEYYMGQPAVAVIIEVIESRESEWAARSGLAALISLGVTIFGASIVFRQLQHSLNTMWHIEPIRLTPDAGNLRRNLFTVIQEFLITTVAALSGGFLLIALLLISTLGTALLQGALPGQLLDPLVRLVVQLLSFVAAPLLFMLIFAAMFKFLPQAIIRWRDLWPGAALTAVLFWLGGYGTGIYLRFSSLSSAYGAASTLTVFLIWVFISMSIVLYGAKFTQLYAHRYGLPIQPKAGATLKPAPPLPGYRWLRRLE
jgi:membrane protein